VTSRSLAQMHIISDVFLTPVQRQYKTVIFWRRACRSQNPEINLWLTSQIYLTQNNRKQNCAYQWQRNITT